MNGIYNIDNRMAKIAREHKIITDYVVKFNRGVKNQDPTFFNDIPSFFSFLAKDLLLHFRFEEIVIFPASLVGESTYGNVLLVMSLQKEHGILETRLQSLISEIEKNSAASDKLSNSLMDNIKLFFEMLTNHNRREMQDLFPMMDNSAKSKALMEIYFKEMSNP